MYNKKKCHKNLSHKEILKHEIIQKPLQYCNYPQTNKNK